MPGLGRWGCACARMCCFFNKAAVCALPGKSDEFPDQMSFQMSFQIQMSFQQHLKITREQHHKPSRSGWKKLAMNAPIFMDLLLFFWPQIPCTLQLGDQKNRKTCCQHFFGKKCFPLLRAIARGLRKKIKGSTAFSRWHTCRADFSQQKWLVCGWCYTLHPYAWKMLLCPKRRFSCFLCILPCAHFTVLFFCGNFGRFRDFFRSNVWRLQIRKNAKSVISLSTFFFQIRKSKKSGARTSAPRVVVGVVEEGGRGGGGRWSNGGRGQKWKGHLCVLRSKTHIIN